ncbi:DUF3885 domain-containing protein [Paenibacillus sp. HN-1]|nr:DUF3885 domain-containing protein [Paenibacillus sp. CGMCC 1.18879]MBY9084694.1 DUF3885 domain-containing protein [Paenibacillus sinensis]
MAGSFIGLFSPYDIYFVNKSRNTIFHFYDSRGLDIVSNSKETLKELYLKRNEWILNYDLERIDSIFNSNIGEHSDALHHQSDLQ